MKRAIIVLSVALICAVSAPWGAQQAQATSVYDSIVQPATSFVVTNSAGTKTTDITNYAYYIAELCPSTTNTLFLNAIANDHYRSIVANDETEFGSSQYAIEFYLETTSPSSTPSYDTVWQDGSASSALIERTNSNLLQFSIHYNYPADELSCTVVSESSSNSIYLASTYDGDALRRPILNTYPITYPDDYEGDLVPTTFNTPSPYKPEWIVNVTAFRGEFSDGNFFTFDNTPFLCDGDLAPVINWEFYDSTNTLIDSGTNSATALFNYTFEAGTYTLRGIYNCGDGDSHTFSNYGEREFTITAEGGLESSDFYACLTDEFPFVDVPACLDNVFIFTQMLLFGKASFGSYFWDAPDDAGCGELAVLDNWIHVDNPYVCPMFPADVRATITPFATFGLSLMLFRVVLGRIHNRGLD
jgi:hypothetical protein